MLAKVLRQVPLPRMQIDTGIVKVGVDVPVEAVAAEAVSLVAVALEEVVAGVTKKVGGIAPSHIAAHAGHCESSGVDYRG